MRSLFLYNKINPTARSRMYLTFFKSKQLEVDRIKLEEALNNQIDDIRVSYIYSTYKSILKIYYKKNEDGSYSIFVDNHESRILSDHLARCFLEPYFQFLLLTKKPIEEYTKTDVLLHLQGNDDYDGHKSFELDIFGDKRIIIQDVV